MCTSDFEEALAALLKRTRSLRADLTVRSNEAYYFIPWALVVVGSNGLKAALARSE
jgi:hypothetical protein